VLFWLLGGCAAPLVVGSNPYEDATEAQKKAFKEVLLPFPVGTQFAVSQGAFGKASHSEPGNGYSWDFDVPFGTPVTAVESGRVLEVWSPALGGGCDPKFSNGAHNVKVEHADGTVAQYVHVDGAVNVGQSVKQGEIIGVTANNGWICQPQLHFGVYASRSELYASPKRKTIPVLFKGLPGGMAMADFHFVVPRLATWELQSRMLHAFLPHPLDRKKKIEIYWLIPEGQGPWPVVISIHGHQEPARPGASDDFGWYRKLAKSGYIAVGVSQPGYGRSDGPPDYCGLFTQSAVQEVIEHFRQMRAVDSKRIALYGVSRGAVVAAMIATKDSGLAALVLDVGFYDMKASYLAYRSSKGKLQDESAIAENMAAEAGASDQAFRERSSLQSARLIRVPTLILTSTGDHPDSERQSKLLADVLKKNGIPVRFVDFPNTGHFIPFEIRNSEIDPFLRKYLASH